MAKPRASTIQQRFGFQDGDLKTPKHDEIMLWLDENAEGVVKQILAWNDDWIDRDRQDATQRAAQAVFHKRYERARNAGDVAELDAWSMGEPPIKPPLEVTREWEYAIVDHKHGGGKYVIGFVDMMVKVEVPYLYPTDVVPTNTTIGEAHSVGA